MKSPMPFAVAFAAVIAIAPSTAGAAQTPHGIGLTFHPRLPARVQAQVEKGELKTAWPLTFGVPFPEGALKSDANLRLLDPSGAEVPIQVRTTARWFDDSIRWVLIDCIAPLSAQHTRYRLQWGGGIARKARSAQRVTVQQDANTLTMDTGAVRAAFSKKQTNLFQSVSVRDKAGAWQPLFPPEARSEIWLEDGTGKVFRGSLDGSPEVVVEEPGPVRVSVKIEGWTRAEDGTRLGRHIVRVQAYAGLRWMRVYHTFVNTADGDEVQFRNIALHLPYQGSRYQFLGVGQKQARQAAQSDYLLQFRHSKFEMVSNGRAVLTGEKSPGRVTVSSGDTAYTVSTRHFWQNFPKEIEAAPGLLKVHFWPRHGKPAEHLGDNMTAKNLGFLWWVHEGEALNFKIPQEFYKFDYTQRDYDNIRQAHQANAFGIAKTHEYWLDFHGAVADPAPRPESIAEVFEANPMMVVDPQWLADSQAFWNIAPRSREFSEVEEAIENTLMFLPAMMDRIGDYGMWNFGSYHQSYLPTLDGARLHRIWKGFHHGAPRWPWLVFARSGDPRLFDFAEVHARALMDVWTCNWEDPAYNKKYWHDPKEGWWAHNFRLKYMGGLCRYKGIVHWFSGMRMFYNSIVDYALWHYYLTGYQRAWDVAMAHGRFLLRARDKLDDPKSGDVYGKRGGMARGAMAITLYRATHDKRFLDLARRQMEFFMKAADTEENDGVAHIYYAPFVERYWEVTHDAKLKDYIVRWARRRLEQNRVWSGRDPFYNMMALGYQFTGDAAFLKYGLSQARVMLENRFTGADPVLEGVIPSSFGGGVGYLGQQWGHFVKALNEHFENTGERLALPQLPDSIPMSFDLWSFGVQPDRKKPPISRLAFHIRKAAGEEVHIPFAFTLRGQGQVTVAATGPTGETRAKQELKPEKGKVRFDFRLAGAEAAGDYCAEFSPTGKGATLVIRWPVHGQYKKLVLEMPFWIRGAGGFYFCPVKNKDGKPGTIRVQTKIRRLYFQSHHIYRPDGTLAAAKSEQGHVNAPLDFNVTVEPQHQDGLWLYSLGSLSHSDGVMLTGDLVPAAAFVREQFFVPDRFRPK